VIVKLFHTKPRKEEKVGMTKREAFQKAQTSIKEKYPHPKYGELL